MLAEELDFINPINSLLLYGYHVSLNQRPIVHNDGTRVFHLGGMAAANLRLFAQSWIFSRSASAHIKCLPCSFNSWNVL